MSKNLYVGNLSFQVTSDDLRELFEPYGDVSSASVVMDRDTGRSRGFGFVEMNSGGDAAIDALNGKDHDGRALDRERSPPAGTTFRRRRWPTQPLLKSQVANANTFCVYAPRPA